MKNRLWAVATPMLLAAAAGGQVPSDTPAGVVRAFHAAVAAGDTARALRLLLPDVVVFESGHVERSRDEYRTSHLPADMAFARATRREIVSERAATSGDVAWVLTESRAVGTFRGRPVDSRGVETVMLRRTAEGWRIAHIHWSSRHPSS